MLLAVLAAAFAMILPVTAGAESSGAQPGTTRGALAALAVGTAHTCAIVDGGGSGGDLYCWGDGGNGRLGQDSTADIGSGPGQVAGLDPIRLGAPAVGVGAGDAHTCALLQGGDVKCWGNNSSGRLGLGDGWSIFAVGASPGDMAALPPVDLGPGASATALAVGVDHTCVILDGGDVKCWGNNTAGALGLGDTRNRGAADADMGGNLPTVDLGTGRTATAIAAGFRHTCALLDDGSVKCWGLGNSGQLGNDMISQIGGSSGQMGDALAPVDLGPGRYATAISAGSSHTCAILDNGTAKCWGSGRFGRLGTDGTRNQGNSDATTMANLGPIPLPGAPTQLVAGDSHTCALFSNGQASCWGNGSDGRLGTGSTSNIGHEPGSMAGLGPISLGRNVRAIAAGGAHTCAALTNGDVKCWGDGRDGRLGLGDETSRGGSAGQMGNNLPRVPLSGDVVPTLAVPAPPTEVRWEPSGGPVAVSWTVPTSNGGSPITGYRVQRSANDGLTWSTVETNTGSTATSATVSGPAGGSVKYRVAALNAAGLGVWSIESAPAGLLPLEPGRIVDTRPGGETVDGLFERIGLRDAGGVLAVDVLGRAGIPDDTAAIVLNVTVNEPEAAGFVTVFPCGGAPPNASNLNHDPGQTIANSVIVKLGDQGRVCFFTDQVSHLIVDVNGAYPLDATFNGLDPARLLDTRPGASTVDGEFAGQGPVPGGQVLTLPVVGRGGVPAGTEAVVLNVTVNDPNQPGFVTVFPCGTAPPNASNLNYTTGQTVPNNVIVKIGDGGAVCLFTDQTANLLVDVNGSFPADATFDPLDPARLLDTRPGTITVDGAFAGRGQLQGGQVLPLQVTGRGGVPADVGAVVVNVTVVDPAQAGFITVFPCGSGQPNASNINFVAGQTIPNNVIVKVGDGGQVCIFSDQTAHLLADVNGSFPPQ